MYAKRTCRNCGAPLVRKPNERSHSWPRRIYCDSPCRGAAQQRAWVDVDGPPWTENEAGCWEWDRVRNADGYGSLSGSRESAHRWVYQHAVGPIPEGLELDHLCRNRACVNPDHLEPVSKAENVRRGVSTKVTPAVAAELRRRYEAIPMQGTIKLRGSVPALAAEFGITRTHLYTILKRVEGY